MRVLESSPRRYDFGLRLLSLGHIGKVYQRVAQLACGPDVLDVGCGTGSLSLRLAARGFHVTGVDLSAEMLDLARQKPASPVPVRWLQTSALELIDHFPPESFDTICCVLLLSELSAPERSETLRQCHRLLRPRGQLLVADEVRAPTLARRFLHRLVWLPLAAITYVFTQASTHPVPGLDAALAGAGFTLVRREPNRLGNFLVIEARKREAPDASR